MHTMKRFCVGILVLAMMAVCLVGCHQHVWTVATCTEPRTCIECGATEGETLPHHWIEATCTTSKSCQNCGVTEGEPLGHDWTQATFRQASYCTRCLEEIGEPIKLFTPNEFVSIYSKMLTEELGEEVVITSEDNILYNIKLLGVDLGTLAFSYIEEGKEIQDTNGSGMCNNASLLITCNTDMSEDVLDMYRQSYVLFSTYILQIFDNSQKAVNHYGMISEHFNDLGDKVLARGTSFETLSSVDFKTGDANVKMSLMIITNDTFILTTACHFE